MIIMERTHSKQELYPVQITANKEISPDVFLLSWKRTGTFIPGQVIKIALDLETPPRIYSLCSGNADEEMSILFDVKPEGVMSPRLAASRPGSQIFVSDPYGSFQCDSSPAFWIATGTGIAPFYSMYCSGLGKNKVLIHGARRLNQFYFRDEFQADLGENYFMCCSSEKAPGVFEGRITDLLGSMTEIALDFKYYLCGGALMVVEVRDLLIGKGVPYEHIISEIYF